MQSIRAKPSDVPNQRGERRGRPQAPPRSTPDPGATVDAILRGRVQVVQPVQGPRFAVDPVLLADFVVRGCGVRAKTACDLGAGTGVLGLVLATLDARVLVSGIEVQPELAQLAQRSAKLSGLDHRVSIQTADLRTARGRFDLVVANPPYHARGAGRVSAHAARALADHELSCTIAEVVQAARRLLAPRGRLAVVFPAERLFDLTTALANERFRLRTLRMVHPRSGRPAARALVLAQLGVHATATVLAPLILHEGNTWSDEAEAILEGTRMPGL
jgi:tRNA1(Val) A37 N6-methylase TrmN6